VRLPSASLLSSRLSEFLVIRGIYSASYPLQVPGKRGYRKSQGLLQISGNPTYRDLTQLVVIVSPVRHFKALVADSS
jgi:hypothetical protein